MSRLHRHRAHLHIGEPLLDALEYHRDIKKRWQEWNRKHYSGFRFAERKTPWYMMTTGKQYNYEERTMPYGQCVNYFRVPSEALIFSHHRSKTTHTQYKNRLIQAKLDDWVKNNPRPVPYNKYEKDLFESFFMLPWLDQHTQAREKIVKFVDNIGSKVLVYARYVDDVGYPRKIMEFRSDHQKLMILDGKYANYLGSKTVRKVQKLANKLGHDDPRLIALRIVDGSQECILIPDRRHPDYRNGSLITPTFL